MLDGIPQSSISATDITPQYWSASDEEHPKRDVLKCTCGIPFAG